MIRSFLSLILAVTLFYSATAQTKQEMDPAVKSGIQKFDAKNYQSALLNFDAAFKKRGLNPGTSADLTVASLFLHAII